MPLITIGQDDINRRKQPDIGWDLYTLRFATEKASKDKQSVNYTFDFEATKEGSKNIGRHLYVRVNSKAPGITMIPMVASLLGIKEDDVQPSQYDTDLLLGKSCYIEVTERTYEGKIQLEANNWASTANVPF